MRTTTAVIALLALADALTAAGLASGAQPELQTPQQMNDFLQQCEWDLMHNTHGIYFPQGKAERVCVCGVNKIAKWVWLYGATTIPPEVERGAGASCMREVGNDGGHGGA